MHRSRILYAVLVLGLVVLAVPAFADQATDAPVTATATDVGDPSQEAAPLEITLDFDAPEISPVSTTTWHFSGREWCQDTHETTPCWTVRFSEPGCPSSNPAGMACAPGSGTCVGNIQYHTYDLFSCY